MNNATELKLEGVAAGTRIVVEWRSFFASTKITREEVVQLHSFDGDSATLIKQLPDGVMGKTKIYRNTRTGEWNDHAGVKITFRADAPEASDTETLNAASAAPITNTPGQRVMAEWRREDGTIGNEMIFRFVRSEIDPRTNRQCEVFERKMHADAWDEIVLLHTGRGLVTRDSNVLVTFRPEELITADELVEELTEADDDYGSNVELAVELIDEHFADSDDTAAGKRLIDVDDAETIRNRFYANVIY